MRKEEAVKIIRFILEQEDKLKGYTAISQEDTEAIELIAYRMLDYIKGNDENKKI